MKQTFHAILLAAMVRVSRSCLFSCVCPTHRLADFFPGFLESKDRGVGESGTDLQDAIEVV